jgi:Flp pilus assembly protein TadG
MLCAECGIQNNKKNLVADAVSSIFYLPTAHYPLPTTDRAGAAAAELAIWLPFLSLMFLVAVDFCRVYYCTQTLQNCAWSGAMYASGASTANPTPSGQDPAIQAALAEGVSLNPPLTTANVSVSYAGGVAQVTVTYGFPLLTTWPGSSGKVTLTRSVSMTMVPQPGS